MCLYISQSRSEMMARKFIVENTETITVYKILDHTNKGELQSTCYFTFKWNKPGTYKAKGRINKNSNIIEQGAFHAYVSHQRAISSWLYNEFIYLSTPKIVELEINVKDIVGYSNTEEIAFTKCKLSKDEFKKATTNEK